MSRTAVIDCFPESVATYPHDYAIVAVDVIRATTTAVTAVASGRRCYPVPSLEVATRLAVRLTDPLLVGELGGKIPYGFDLNNSPADVEIRADTARPMILLSTGGTRLICGAAESHVTYVTCLRNYYAQATYLTANHDKVAVIGAGSRAEFRDEDQLCCAWIVEKLLSEGFEPEDARTEAVVERWRDKPVDALVTGASADYLRRSGQVKDLEFVLQHVDDLNEVYCFTEDHILDQKQKAYKQTVAQQRAMW